jgi:hypothetical protein
MKKLLYVLARAFDRELKTNGMVVLERTDQARLSCQIRTKRGTQRRSLACVNKGCARVDMSENGKVNWKSDDGVLLQELWRPNRSEEGSGKTGPHVHR